MRRRLEPHVLQPPSAQALDVKPIISVPSSKSSTPIITESQVAVTGKTDKNLKPFLEVVRANFPAWDQNHDGTIDRKEIEVAAQDAKYTGDAAAALAVLKIDADAKIAAKKDLGLSHLSDIDTIQSKSDSGEKIDSDFGKIFARCQYKLKTVPRQLYIDALPHLSMIHQGSTLDCYFLASLGGLLETNPRVIVDMIQQNPDGTYNVIFPGKPPLKISAPTETELAAYTHSNDGFWLNIIEKAFGEIRHIAPQNYTAEPLDAVALNRGSCGEVIRLLTGNSTTRLDFHKTPEVISSQNDTDLKSGTPANASDSSKNVSAAYPPADEEMLGQTRALLKATFAAHKIATASKNRHAYTIVAYDIGHDLVTVHNPYGTSGIVKWPDGTKGPRMQNGYYICSIPDFVRYYRSISVEK